MTTLLLAGAVAVWIRAAEHLGGYFGHHPLFGYHSHRRQCNWFRHSQDYLNRLHRYHILASFLFDRIGTLAGTNSARPRAHALAPRTRSLGAIRNRPGNENEFGFAGRLAAETGRARNPTPGQIRLTM